MNEKKREELKKEFKLSVFQFDKKTLEMVVKSDEISSLFERNFDGDDFETAILDDFEERGFDETLEYQAFGDGKHRSLAVLEKI